MLRHSVSNISLAGQVQAVLVQATKVYDCLKVWLCSFSSLDTSGSKCIASCLGCFTPGKTGPSTHWIGCQMDPRISRNALEKSKTNYVSSRISCTFQELYLKNTVPYILFFKKQSTYRKSTTGTRFCNSWFFSCDPNDMDSLVQFMHA